MNEVTVELFPHRTGGLFKRMKQDLVVQLRDEEIDAVNAAALSGKLCQMANGAVYGEDHQAIAFHDRKLDALEDLLEAAKRQSRTHRLLVSS